MERRTVPQGELLQGKETRVVEHMRAGQEDRLPGRLAAERLARVRVTVGAGWERGEADGTLVGLPVQRLPHTRARELLCRS